MTLLLAMLLVWPATGAPAASQSAARGTPPTGALVVEVVDSTGGLLPAAAVFLRRGQTTVADATTGGEGVARLSVAPGRYQLLVSLDGFEPVERTVEVPARREQRVRVELGLTRLAETLTVAAASADATETTIDADQIAGLADDPDALEAFIADVAGPDADVRVDGFSGGRTPRKSQVAQIIVIADPYSAQFHSVGQAQVNVVTKPGFGEWHGWTGGDLATRALAARDVFARERLGYRKSGGWLSASGPITRARTSVSIDAYLRRDDEQAPTVALTSAGTVRGASRLTDNSQSAELRFTTALGAQTLLRNRVEVESSTRTGAALSDLDLPERALRTTRRRINARSGVTTRLAHGIEQELRLFGSWQRDTQVPLTEALTITVLGAFRAGGAQNRGSTTVTSGQLEGNWTLPAHGRHTLRAGGQLDATARQNASRSNYLGTFVFASLEDYAAGRPVTYTRRLGGTDLDVRDTRAGVYAQDQIRLTRTLQAGIGVRQEWQPAVDAPAPAPRFSLAWSQKGGWTVRGGVGRFRGWYEATLLEEAQRLDGTRFTEVVIASPDYPDPLGTGLPQTALPSTRLVAAPGVTLPAFWRASLTAERKVGVVGLRATAYRQGGSREPRARNANIPVDGVRPNPAIGNLLVISSVGQSRNTGLDLTANTGPLWHKRVQGSLSYSLAWSRNDADGALSLPADPAHPELEWGPSRGDVRHRLWSALTARGAGLTLNLYTRAQSASPYTITTGYDDNGDSVTNDRPAGVGRNTARGTGRLASDLRLSWGRTVGGRRAGGGAGGSPAGGARGATRIGGKDVGVTLAAYNVFNQRQNAGFGGVLTSPLFGQPTSALNARRINLSMQVGF